MLLRAPQLAALAALAVAAVAPASTQLNGVDNFKVPAQSAYCRQFRDAKPADGKQFFVSRACSSVIQGAIPGNNDMVSLLITQPAFGATVDRNKKFNVRMLVRGLSTGFALPENQYLLAPQTLDQNTGTVQGHVKLVIQKLTGDSAPKAESFAFFQSMTERDQNGAITATIPPGTIKQDGEFRICAMAVAAAHQLAIMPVAQRGSQNECIRATFKAGGGGNNNGNNKGNNGNNKGKGGNTGVNKGGNKGGNTGGNKGANKGGNKGGNKGANTGGNKGGNTGGNKGANNGGNKGANQGGNKNGGNKNGGNKNGGNKNGGNKNGGKTGGAAGGKTKRRRGGRRRSPFGV
nr:hypothetical protein HK105_000212 [Polyrhizophydium stewartii]